MGRVLFMYRIVKLKIFLGSLDWATDQRAFSCESENFLTLRKKELGRSGYIGAWLPVQNGILSKHPLSKYIYHIL